VIYTLIAWFTCLQSSARWCNCWLLHTTVKLKVSQV